ncbi:MAG: GNAT family N-acetyltransferase [Pelagimonas sp.]|uniref:GNAT family N-acetyltransferase n=1 Tax=Pelagimonas sp. TaxID=2073170 RepID=UPI003D6C27CA
MTTHSNLDMPTAERLFAAVDGTWPAAALVEAGPWLLREGRGGGKRVSAATTRAAWRPDDLSAAESAMRLMGQDPLFMIRGGDEALDQALETRGYDDVDPTNIRLAPIGRLTDRALPPVTAFSVWEPLAVMHEIWDEGGLDPARLRIMDRCTAPKIGLFGRVSDRPAGSGFCAIHDGIALVHALEIRKDHRGKGLGAWMMRCAALWAERKGAHWIGALVTQANDHANGLYASLDLNTVGHYHYRILRDDAESEDS